MPDTRVGGGSFEAIIATLDQLTEAIDLLNRVDDQRAQQLASLEAAHANLSTDVLALAKQFRALQDTVAEVLALVRDLIDTPRDRL